MGHLELYFVTDNRGKLREVENILKQFGIKVVQASVRKTEIQSNDLGEIALYAARRAFLQLRKPLFVEDAGLFIDSLNGFPGPYSSYVYKTIGVKGVLKLLEGVTNRRACFKSYVALILPPLEKLFMGEVCGVISDEARGSGGFGFDPIFRPEGSAKTFAEMSLEEKNRYSHRAKAVRAMGEWLAKTFHVKP